MTPASVTAYDLTTGRPVDGLAPTITSVRHNADNTWTPLSVRAGVGAGNGTGVYAWSYSELELPAGTYVRWYSDFGDGVATSRFYDGQVDGLGLGLESGLQLAAAGAAAIQVTPGTKYLKEGDTAPLQWNLVLDDGSGGFDLTDCTVKLFAANRAGTVVINGETVDVLDAAGLVQYQPADDDFEDAGSLLCQFEVTLPDGKKRTAPSEGNALLIIEPKL